MLAKNISEVHGASPSWYLPEVPAVSSDGSTLLLDLILVHGMPLAIVAVVALDDLPGGLLFLGCNSFQRTLGVPAIAGQVVASAVVRGVRSVEADVNSCLFFVGRFPDFDLGDFACHDLVPSCVAVGLLNCLYYIR